MYDLAILGGGPAGYVAAERAGAKGLSVVLFERKELGGVCLNEGCIPTKTLLYSAKVFDYAKHSDKYGVGLENPSVDFARMMKRKTKVVRKLVGGVKLKMKNASVEVVKGDALIEGRTPEGVHIRCNDAEYIASGLLVCTGSEAAVPPIPGLAEAGETVVTNREILALESAPESLVIIGGGVIGMEFASFFNSIGTKVTVVEMLPKILGPLDDEISTMLQGIYAGKGVEFNLESKVVAIEGNTVVFEDKEGNTCRVSGEKILVSVGRRANIAGIGLESLGLEMLLNRAGRPCGIKVDDHMRTSAEGVYAAGDVTGFSMLAHTASREAEVAVSNICGEDASMSYAAIPGIVYTNPEVAGVGMTEAEAAAKGIAFKVAKLPMAYSGRFVAENEGGEGICKVIVGEDEKVLGVHMLGNPCSEIVSAACIAIETGMTVSALRKIVFPHPTVSEIVKETLYSI